MVSAQEARRGGYLCGLQYETCNHREVEIIRSDLAVSRGICASEFRGNKSFLFRGQNFFDMIMTVVLRLFLAIEARGGRYFRTMCPIVVRSGPQRRWQRPDPAKRRL